MVPWGKFLTKREGEDEYEQHTGTSAPLTHKGALCTQSSSTGTRGPLGPILFNIIINAHSTDPQKLFKKFGTQGLHSRGHCKSSALVSWSGSHNSNCKRTEILPKIGQ